MLLVLVISGEFSGCSTTPVEMPARLTPLPPILADADSRGAVVIDAEAGELFGVRRSAREPAWTSSAAADRMHIACSSACPAVFASGAYRTIGGRTPGDYTVRFSADGDTSTESTTEKVVATRRLSGSISYEDASSGAVVTYRRPNGSTTQVSAEMEPLVFRSRDDREIVMRISQTQALHLVAVNGGWQAKTLTNADLDLACVDSERVILGSNDTLMLEGRTVVRTDSQQLGSCDIWGDYILAASFSTSTDTGDATRVELWTTDGVRLWSRELTTLAVPALVSPAGEVAVLDEDGLHILSRQGGELRRVPDVVDVHVPAANVLVALFRDGNVKWL